MKRRIRISTTFILIALVCTTSLFTGCSNKKATPGTAFDGSIILGRPTNTTMMASVTALNECEVYVQWGEKSENYNGKSETLKSTRDVPAVLTMDNLTANTQYYYRLFFKENGSNDFKNTDEYSFSTPKSTGSEFNFVVQSDSHLKNKADPDLYTQSMQNMAALKPDFIFDMGDTFLNDQATDASKQSYDAIAETVRQQLPYFDIVTRNAPLFYTIGNHEGEYGAWLDRTKDNLAAKSTIARTTYIPNPIPNDFYSGNSQEEELLGYVQNYYAFTWGDALFVSIDPYRYGIAASDEKSDGWSWSLGKTQYDWFRKTLEESTAKYKFVFSHHAIGNIRGGEQIANLYEWGGYDQKGAYLFDQKRPGWGKPIQQVMKDTGVTVFFQGHDHLFARETVDGVVYQTLPKPAENIADQQNNFSAYPNADVVLNSGFLNVSVTDDNVQIDYFRNYFVASGSQETNTGIVYSYTVDDKGNVNVLKTTEDDLSTYGKNDTSASTSNQDKSNSNSSNKNKKEKTTSQTNSSEQTGNNIVTASNMTTVPQGGFSFAIDADPHWDENTSNDLLKSTLTNVKSSSPDFLIDLGDTSMAEKLAKTQSEIESRFATVKSFFDLLGGLPIYSVLGNHDGESGIDPSKTAMVRSLRIQTLPLPSGTEHFTGNTTTANYYSFTKNNVQFIVLDPYTYTKEKIGQKGNGWASTLGKTQYDWLKNTLAGSTAKFKFVFIHNLAGGISKDQRGGAEAAEFFEWGGKNANGVDEFSKMRPGWDMPIHDLFVKYGVDIVFHGHDHFYAKQDKDGIVYQLVPQPGTPGNSINSASEYGYSSGTLLPSAGFLRVVVSYSKVTVEYLKTEGNGNQSIANVYSIQ